MIASLSMYDRPETAEAWDALWQGIRTHLDRSDAPEALTRDADLWQVWTAPSLLLGQTCGMPYRTRLYDKVTLVGTLDHGLVKPAGYYNSVIVAQRDRAQDPLSRFAGQRFAYNDGVSQSGWAAPITLMRDNNMLPGSLLQTGAHRASAQAVADGQADFAALDCVSWLHMSRHDGFAADLVVIAETPPTPGLPLIIAKSEDPAPLRAAIRTAIEGLSPEQRDTLHLFGLVEIPAAEYLAVPTPLGPVLTEQTIRLQGHTAPAG
ncbi:PhnD/SsuA/transferrin family substrate-binding protein [Phaeobacter sp.]|uniref:phosphate/phosphite/phosphonate ABC transporter substrate-binding protein n=1 Tax=Phaeobacter sp. TaxID=1902409 RepID=UPI0025F0781B|nr:PhnD/SsuA/transferrin family substrate-binding protein [Phaeobacter sp.]